MGVVEAIQRYDATCGADSEVGRIVDQPADLYQVVEDGRVDWAGARGVVVDVDEGLEDLVGELQPWPVEGRDVTPVSAVSIDQQLGLAHWQRWSVFSGEGTAQRDKVALLRRGCAGARCDISSAHLQVRQRGTQRHD